MPIKPTNPDDTAITLTSCAPKPEFCHANLLTERHEFIIWQDFPDGNGGELLCKHCGLGAMEYSLRTGP